jgi:hypothetical protein
MFQNIVIHFQFFVLKPSYNFPKCNISCCSNVTSFNNAPSDKAKIRSHEPPGSEKSFYHLTGKVSSRLTLTLEGAHGKNYFVLSCQMTFRKDGQHCVDEDLIIIIKVQLFQVKCEKTKKVLRWVNVLTF